MQEAEAFKRLYPEEYLDRFLVKDIRPDGRGLRSTREISVHASPLSSAPGSAVVRMGNTTVITSVELGLFDLGEESVAGRLEHELDVGPLGTTHNNGSIARNRQQTSAVSGRVRQILCRSIDLGSLKLSEPGEEASPGGGKAWALHVKSVCLSLDGCLFDATLASAVAALATLRFPRRLEQLGEDAAGEDGGRPEGDGALRFLWVPACTAVALHKGRLLVDPTDFEESLASAVVAVVWGRRADSPGGEEPEVLALELGSEGQRASVDAQLVRRCLGVCGGRGTSQRLAALASLLVEDIDGGEADGMMEA